MPTRHVYFKIKVRVPEERHGGPPGSTKGLRLIKDVGRIDTKDGL